MSDNSPRWSRPGYASTDRVPNTDPSIAEAAESIARALWRQETIDAITRRLVHIADDLAVTHAALVPTVALDRDALAPVYDNLSDARTAIETALHGLDQWAGADRAGDQ